MSQYVFLQQSNGEYLKVLADDNGVIQYTTNQADFAGVKSASAASNVASVSGASVDNSVPTAPVIKAPNGWTLITVTGSAKTDQDIPFAGDSGYVLETISYIVGGQASADCAFTLQPNAINTNGAAQYNFSVGASLSSHAEADIPFAYVPDVGGRCFTKMTFLGKSGTQRWADIRQAYEVAASTGLSLQDTVARWTDTATVITKLTVHAGVANGIGVGSYFLYRTVPIGA